MGAGGRLKGYLKRILVENEDRPTTAGLQQGEIIVKMLMCPLTTADLRLLTDVPWSPSFDWPITLGFQVPPLPVFKLNHVRQQAYVR
jgi:hypothetical protein